MGFPDNLCDLWENSLEHVFTEGTQKSLEYAYKAPCGGEYFAFTVLVPEFGPCGSVESVLGVTHNVTELKAFEKELAKADRLKDEFIATLAHELRNPLAPVRTGLQVLRITQDADAFRETLDMMDRQLGQMTRLIDDLLDVSRIASAKVQLRLERVSVGSIVDRAVEAARPILEAARHTLVVNVPQPLLWLDADPTRLAQVISNLLNNAAKYSPDASCINLAVYQENTQVVIQVKDTGVGIPEDMLNQVFEMFTQVDRTLDRAQGGLGIGLAIVKQLVDLHHGNVLAESPGPGKGSTFTIRLPAAQAPHLAASTLMKPPQQKLNAERRILVVDDNVDGASTLAFMLGLSGHKTRTAFSGFEALNVSSEFLPEIVFLDIGLPDMTGYEVARRLRADDRWQDLILVALTGWGSESDLIRSKHAGFDMHLTKPVDPCVFDDVIARFEVLRKDRLQGHFKKSDA
jgi:CheY-like chemotaxis protein/nitrogen-specific signal transduction histidine kinase